MLYIFLCAYACQTIISYVFSIRLFCRLFWINAYDTVHLCDIFNVVIVDHMFTQFVYSH